MHTQTSLFDDFSTPNNAVQKKDSKKNKTNLSPLEKESKRFEKLLIDIELIEKEAKINEEEKERAQQEYFSKCIPELQRLAETKLRFLLIVEKIFDQNDFKNNEQKSICEFVINYADDSISYNESLRTLYKRFYNISLSLLSNKEKKKLANRINNITEGKVTLNENDFGNDSFFENTFDGFNEWQQEEQKQQSKNIDNDINDAQFINTKDLYKELAKALHPDLEQDEKIKTIKVALMQELSIAKQNNDLFAMLQIQKKGAAYIKEDNKEKYYSLEKLKAYNKLLKQKYEAIKMQLQAQIYDGYAISNNGTIKKKDNIKATLKYIKSTINETQKSFSFIKDKYSLMDFIEFQLSIDDDEWF
jgi:hypothetical protein